MPKYLISILMSVRNAEPYLEATLESIIRQKERNWELIAVNNNSSDNSVSILQSFVKRDNRIKLLHNKSNSLIRALRTAYASSSGRLITRMDADDIMPTAKLYLLKEILEQNGPGHIATGMVEYFSEEKLGMGYKQYASWLNTLMKTNSNFSEIYKECVIPSPCWMVYREDFEQCGAYEPEVYPEDYDLCFRFYKQRLKVIASKEVLHRWRDYPDRASRTDPEYADQRFLEIKIRYFLELDFNNEIPLVLWGAGKKGKWLAGYLSNTGTPFVWVTNNERKIGSSILGVKLMDFSQLKEMKDYNAIIAVASPDGQKDINSFLRREGKSIGKDFFFFC